MHLSRRRQPIRIAPSKFEPPEQPQPPKPSQDNPVKSEQITVQKSQRIWKQGEPFGWVGIIVEGSVKVQLRSGVYVTRGLFNQSQQFFKRGLIKGVQTLQKTTYVKVSRDDFNTHLLSQDLLRNAEAIKILQHNVFFKSWSVDALNLVASLLMSLSISAYKILYETSSPVDSLYFVKSGCLRVSPVSYRLDLLSELKNYQKGLKKQAQSNQMMAIRGNCVGVDGILIGLQRVYEVSSEMASQLLLLQRASFISLYNTYMNSFDLIPEQSQRFNSLATQQSEPGPTKFTVFTPELPAINPNAKVITRQLSERRQRIRSVSRQKLKNERKMIKRNEMSSRERTMAWLKQQQQDYRAQLRRSKDLQRIVQNKRQLLLGSIPRYSIKFSNN